MTKKTYLSIWYAKYTYGATRRGAANNNVIIEAAEGMQAELLEDGSLMTLLNRTLEAYEYLTNGEHKAITITDIVEQETCGEEPKSTPYKDPITFSITQTGEDYTRDDLLVVYADPTIARAVRDNNGDKINVIKAAAEKLIKGMSALLGLYDGGDITITITDIKPGDNRPDNAPENLLDRAGRLINWICCRAGRIIHPRGAKYDTDDTDDEKDDDLPW